ncbi:hypothetical protein BKA70DRAFT_1388344 [Coprinopsis sp. MPI-PUGE-AT-0042]|nr:hypothetical protein BKA70DRAFT_1388344 [Coprinopsis sp. MPI-PUGE-AT-0042]
MLKRCPGCGELVKARGLRMHALRSGNPRCTGKVTDDLSSDSEFDEAAVESLPVPSNSSSLPNLPSPGIPPNSEPIPRTPDIGPTPEPELSEGLPLPLAPEGFFDPTQDLFRSHGILLDTIFSGGDAAEAEDEEAEDEGTAEDDEDLDVDGEYAQQEGGLEPARNTTPLEVVMDVDEDRPLERSLVLRLRGGAEGSLNRHPFAVRYRKQANDVHGEGTAPGETFYKDQQQHRQAENVYAPFESQIDWEVARWAKLRGPSSTAFSELMAIEGVADRLGLSYRNSVQLNKKIDNHLSGRPGFTRQEVMSGGEVCELYYRDVVACVRALFSDPDFAPYLVFAPERHYTGADKDCRVFHDMHTGKWWWATQEAVEREKPGATIVPINLATDKTLLTLFRNKQAYPLYLTIGNIPKEIWRKVSSRAYVLLAYLPTTKLENVTNKASRRRQLNNLYHACMTFVLSPLRQAGVDGVLMSTGKGLVHRNHLILATFNGDYPEQCLATGVQSGCPTCETKWNDLDDFDNTRPLRNLEKILDALDSFDHDPANFLTECSKSGIKPIVEPFWKELPYVHIFQSITPDILHQLHQGVFKHLVQWVIAAYGPTEIDARCRRLPPNHNIRLFMKGISCLSRITGHKHAQMARILLGLVVDMKLPGGHSPVRLVRAIRALLDFLYLAQYPVHTDETLEALDEALKAFHENKAAFIDLGIRDGFRIPKLHFASHWAEKIRLFGTADNLDTEYTERLHIDLAKDAYAATNRKDEFAQMTTWLERKEKIYKHEQYIQWRIDGEELPPVPRWQPPGLELDRERHLSKFPSTRRVSIPCLVTEYGAIHFKLALARFVSQLNNPTLTPAQLERSLWNTRIPLQRFPVWHRIKWRLEDSYTRKVATVDSVHCRPSTTDSRHHPVPARFDTALINLGEGQPTGLEGYRVGRVRVVFALPEHVLSLMFKPEVVAPAHLAYVEWYTPFAAQPEANHGMYKIKATRNAEGHMCSVIPVANIRRSVHLYPKCGPSVPPEWKSSNVLDLCDTFLLNDFSDKHAYRIII